MNENPHCPVTCPHCLSGTAVLWEELGRNVTCQTCGHSFVAEPPPQDTHLWKEDGTPRKTWPAWAVLIVGGLLCLTVAAFLWQVSIRQPMEEMVQHAPEVSYSMKRVVFIPLFALGGAGLTLMGLFGMLFKDRLHVPGRGGKAMTLIIFVALMIPGWFLHSWFENEMNKLGYERGVRGLQPRVNVIPVPPMDFSRQGSPIAAPELKNANDRFNERVKDVQENVRKLKKEADPIRER